MKNIQFTQYIYLLFFSLLSVSLMSQARYFDERYISTQSYINPVIINPGAVGSSEYHRIIGNYRNNWASFPGSPKTFNIGYDGPVGNNIGVGAQFISDNNGDLSTSKVQGAVAYTIDGLTNKVGLGISGEFVQHGVDDVNILSELHELDEVVNGRLDGLSYFDLSFGAFGTYNNSINYGLVLPGLLSSRLSEGEDLFDGEFSYILHLGYDWDVPGYDLSIEPSIMVKQLQYVPFHVDINAKASFLEDRFMGGLNYTVGADERIGFLIGTRVNSFNFYYSYSLSRNEFQAYNNGGHELSIRVDLGRNDRLMDKEMLIEDSLPETPTQQK